MARALRPDGLFIAACPGGNSLHELRDVLTRAEAEVTGGLSPRPAHGRDPRSGRVAAAPDWRCRSPTI